MATSAVGNLDHENITIAGGRMRWLGRRPVNLVSHDRLPSTRGGEGKTSAGRHPVTPWDSRHALQTPITSARTRFIVKPAR